MISGCACVVPIVRGVSVVRTSLRADRLDRKAKRPPEMRDARKDKANPGASQAAIIAGSY
jgi:hypothetical protein